MLRATLGRSGIECSAVGLGTWPMGGWMWGGTDETSSINAIHAALDAGVDLIDTAPVYGFGLSETTVGKAIRDRRDSVVLATKCGMVCNTTRGETKFRSNSLGPDPHGHLAVQVYLGADSIRQEVEGSLERLQTDTIDLLQPHWQDPTTPVEETMAALIKLKEEGKIRAIGVCNAPKNYLRQYDAAGQLDTDQECFSMLDRQIEEDQLPFCREHEIAVLAYSPLARGLLTGKMGPDREFAEGDARRDSPRFSVENRQRVANMLEQFRPIAETHDATIAQIVIAWTIRFPGVTHALVGARNPQQATENAAAGSIELSPDEVSQITRAVDQYREES